MKSIFIFPPLAVDAVHGPQLASEVIGAQLKIREIGFVWHDWNLIFTTQFADATFLQRNLLDNHFLSVMEADYLKHYIRLKNKANFHYKSLFNIIKKILFPGVQSFNDLFHSCLQTDEIFQSFFDLHYSKLNIEEGDIICISNAFAEQLEFSFKIAYNIKKLNPNQKIVIGGSQISLLSKQQREQIFSTDFFDQIFTGNNLSEFISFLQENKLGKGFENNVKENVLNYSFAFNNINQTNTFFSPVEFPVLVSLGCYYGKCHYCDYVRLNDVYKERDVELVYNDLLNLKNRLGDISFFLVSDALSPVWLKRFVAFLKLRKQKFKLRGYVMHSEVLDFSLLSDLKEIGFNSVTFGTEALQNDILRKMNKGVSSEIILQNLKESSTAGLKNAVNIIPDFPGTTFEQRMENVEMLEKNKALIFRLNVQWFNLTSGTHVSEHPQWYNIDIFNREFIYTHHGFHSLNFNDNSITDEQRLIIKNRISALAAKINLQGIKPQISDNITENMLMFFNPDWFVSGNLLCNFDTNIQIEITIEYAVFFNNVGCRGNVISVGEFKEFCEQQSLSFIKELFNLILKGLLLKII